MPVQTTTTFTKYTLTEAEYVQAQLLTTLQKCAIQNMLADIADNKLSLVLDPSKPSEFVQHEAFLRGQIEILRYLLILSEASEIATNQQLLNLDG